MKIVAALAVAIAAVVLTPAAHADPCHADPSASCSPNVQFEDDLLNIMGLNPVTLHLPTPTLKAEDDLGNAICEHLGSGTDANEIVNVIMTDGHLSQNDARGVVGFAVIDLCPNVSPCPLPWFLVNAPERNEPKWAKCPRNP